MPPPRFKRPALDGEVTLRSFTSQGCCTTATIRKGELVEDLESIALRVGLCGTTGSSPLCVVDAAEMAVLNKLVAGGEYYIGGGAESDLPGAHAASCTKQNPDVPVAWAFDPRVLLHEPSSHRSPETPHRLARAIEMLQQNERAAAMLPRELRHCSVGDDSDAHNLSSFITPRFAELQEILSWHDKSVYERFLTTGSALENLRSDVYCNEGTSSSAVKLSAAAVIDAGEAVLQSVANARAGVESAGPLAAMCLVRPPGHHCTASQPSGFCLINNVAVACKRLLGRQYYLSGPSTRAPKIAIVDLDVHFGEGTAEFVESVPSQGGEASAIYMSLHRYDCGTFYPGDARGAAGYHGKSGPRRIFNIAVDTYATDPKQCEKVISDHLMSEALERGFIPLLDHFQPDLVVISLGFDAAYGDPLGRMAVEGGFARAVAALKSWCFENHSHSTAGLLIALEGGYNPEAVSQGIVSVAHALTFPASDPDVQLACRYRCPRTWHDVRHKLQRQAVEQQQLRAECDNEGTAPVSALQTRMATDELQSDEMLMTQHKQWCAALMDQVRIEFGLSGS